MCPWTEKLDYSSKSSWRSGRGRQGHLSVISQLKRFPVCTKHCTQTSDWNTRYLKIYNWTSSSKYNENSSEGRSFTWSMLQKFTPTGESHTNWMTWAKKVLLIWMIKNRRNLSNQTTFSYYVTAVSNISYCHLPLWLNDAPFKNTVLGCQRQRHLQEKSSTVINGRPFRHCRPSFQHHFSLDTSIRKLSSS